MSRILTFQYEPEAAPVIQRLLCGELAIHVLEDREEPREVGIAGEVLARIPHQAPICEAPFVA